MSTRGVGTKQRSETGSTAGLLHKWQPYGRLSLKFPNRVTWSHGKLALPTLPLYLVAIPRLGWRTESELILPGRHRVGFYGLD